MIKTPWLLFFGKSLQNPEHSQNVIICPCAHYQQSLKTALKSIHMVSAYFANKQTPRWSLQAMRGRSLLADT